MNIKKFIGAIVLTLGVGFGVVGFNEKAEAYQINNEFNLPPGTGSGQYAYQNYIILHETANERATGRNEATYMRNNWFNAHTTDIVGDGGIVYRVGQWGMVTWGAGAANPYAPVQIELQHTHDKELFAKNYKAYVDLTRDAAKYYNIPLTLDAGGAGTPGVKSHKWVTDNIWGDHTDPYGYLAEMGISKDQLARDLINGVNGPVTPEKPVKPTPAKTFKKGQNVFVYNGHKSNNGPVVPFVPGANLWTQIGTITEVKKGAVNMYKIENSGKFVTYANAGDLVDLNEWAKSKPTTPAKPQTPANNIVPVNGTFTVAFDLPVSGDVDPNSPALDTYAAGMSFAYDGYVVANGYVWLTYINYGGGRSYVAVGPNDNNPANTWGWGF